MTGVPREDDGGEPACLLHLVCPDCGLVLDDPESPCSRCVRAPTDPGSAGNPSGGPGTLLP